MSPVQAAQDLLNTGQSRQQLLKSEEAFILSVTLSSPTAVVASWDIAEGYYLYKEKIEFNLEDAEGVSISKVDMPPGKIKEDEFFGSQEVFYHQLQAIAHLQREPSKTHTVSLKVSYQGCAEVGVCYPPISLTIPVVLPAAAIGETGVQAPSRSSTETPAGGAVMEQDIISRMLVEQRFWAMPAFFGFGLLLAFTPCVFPMIPILSSLIVGRGRNITQRQAFMLSLVYVLAMAVTYTVAGILAAHLGQNIQALFQNPWVVVTFSAIFVLLALSMFGFYDLQLPTSWQSRLTELSNRHGGGSHTGVAIMVLLSALLVGPCVAPPLIGVLAVIAATGDVFLGGSALFIMSLGMGAPLLAIGASAGQLLPRAGHWMDRVKFVFGILLLGIAIWMLERVLPPPITMLLWAILIIVTATFMGVFQPIKPDMSGWQRLVKGLGVALLIYGILLLVGMAAGSKDPLQPLRGIGLVAGEGAAREPVKFRSIKTLADLKRELNQAGKRPVMLDFYADWCGPCKMLAPILEDTKAELREEVKIVKIDVDKNQSLAEKYHVRGVPTLILFKNGEQLWRKSGVVQKTELVELVRSHS
jgi:thiol:disulfide interchange protein DsbD